jgi:murein DD-endopeptidase MepM/ murein hydrolase activator NlpD
MDVPTGINPAAAYPLARFDRDLGSIQSQIQASETATGETRLDELRNVTQQFEALFLSYLMKVMRSSVEVTDSDASSMGKDIYTEMFDSEIASNISRTQSLGIGDLLYRQLEYLAERQTNEKAAPQIDDDSEKSIPVTSPYGIRKNPFDGLPQFHKGVDLAAPAGMPFRSVEAGTVVHAGWLGDYGKTVIVEHPNGDRTLYAHASSILVREGNSVDTEQMIGIVGSSGHTTGPHLHFELRRDGTSIDPNAVLAVRSPLFSN